MLKITESKSKTIIPGAINRLQEVLAEKEITSLVPTQDKLIELEINSQNLWTRIIEKKRDPNMRQLLHLSQWLNVPLEKFFPDLSEIKL